jgi:hypothetical protein
MTEVFPRRGDLVAFDKDSTLADTSHRRWLALKVVNGEENGYTWLDYSRACTDDKPVEAARELMYLLAPYYTLYVMTGSEDCREAREWLRVHRFPYSQVLFRQPGDRTENGLLKVRWIRELQEKGYKVRLFVEDYVETAKVIEEETGVPVLTLNPRYEGTGPELSL